jgi:hypothetical protein
VEDVDEWKEALERALEAAPNAALVVGHDTAFRHESHDSFEGSAEHGRGRRPVKSLVVGRPILLALEDIDGSPSFLEKALRFIEQYGTVSMTFSDRQGSGLGIISNSLQDPYFLVCLELVHTQKQM